MGLCLRGPFDGYWLQREGKTDDIENFALVCVRARQVGVALSVTICGVEVRELRQANEILRTASAYFAWAELDRPFKR